MYNVFRSPANVVLWKMGWVTYNIVNGFRILFVVIAVNNNMNNMKYNEISKNKRIIYDNFEKEFFNQSIVDDQHIIIDLDNNFYLINKDSFDRDLFLRIRNLNVFRNGLLLGEIKGKNFIPSHAITHAFDIKMYKNVISLDNNNNLMLKYLKGESIELDDSNISIGYVAVSYAEVILGLSKVQKRGSKFLIKNLYPKGLRNL